MNREQTEFALSLYRDHEAVAYVLGHVNLPEGAERVALAVDAVEDGPVVLVTRDGRFVTCLGAGMRHCHHVVPRKQLDALLARAADKRARRELRQRELRPDEEEGDLLQRIFTRGSRLAREDFVVLTSFEGLVGLAPFLSMLDVGFEAVKARQVASPNSENAVVKGSTTKALEKIHRCEWAVAHLTLLAGAAERRQLDAFLGTRTTVQASATFPCSVQGGSTFYLRAAWMTARFGKAVIPSVKAGFFGAGDWMSALDAGVGLAAIGLRHSSCMSEIRRIFEGFDPPVPAPTTPDESRRNVAASMLRTMNDADENIGAILKVGRSFAVTLSGRLPAGHPRRYEKPEDVPDDVARTAALSFDGNMFEPQIQGFTVAALSTAVRAAAEDFYHPRDIVRAWFGAWSPEETLERLRRFARAETKLVPVRASATPGRNDPCSCGSGKKWKKCHGSAQA